MLITPEWPKLTIKWIKTIKWGELFLCGLIYLILATVIRQIEVILTMKYYLMPQYFGVWSQSMMPNAGPPPPSFMIKSATFTFASGLSIGLVYYYIKNLLPKQFWHRVTFFADLMIGTSFIFFTLPVYLLFNLPIQLLLSWFISGFIILFLTSLTLVKVIK
ncbi:MAG: hypothetical protein ACD_12C00266G0005 [uncultured bacterium]|nr:MAG: hypothetical protein ACD_12C00266G0005 [uncultured bacterium]